MKPRPETVPQTETLNGKPRRRRLGRPAAFLVSAIGVYLLAAGSAACLTGEPPAWLGAAGGFLVSAFPWAWPLLPAYCLVAALLLFRGSRRRDQALFLTLSLVPVLTALVLVRFLADPEAAYAVFPSLSVLGPPEIGGAGLVLLAVEIVLSWNLSRLIFPVGTPERKAPEAEGSAIRRLIADNRLPADAASPPEGEPKALPSSFEPIVLKSTRRRSGAQGGEELPIPGEVQAAGVADLPWEGPEGAFGEDASPSGALAGEAAGGAEPAAPRPGGRLSAPLSVDGEGFSEFALPPEGDDPPAADSVALRDAKEPQPAEAEGHGRAEPGPRSEGGEDRELPPGIAFASTPPQEVALTPQAEGQDRKSSAIFRRPKPYSVPVEGILNKYPDGQYWIIDEQTRHQAEILKTTLEEFQVSAEVTGIRKGPVITMFEILPAPGVKLSKIVGLQDNIALRLAAQSIRIVAPIPGKHAVGIEVPNLQRAIVSFREMIESEAFNQKKMEIPVVLGKDIQGEVQVIDLTTTPHLLIAGATGAGKSVCVNSLILSVLYKRTPEEVKMLMIDPKIVELKLYNDIPHLLTPVITEPKKAFQALQYCICEMERRYSLLDGMGVRDIRSYNRRIKERNIATTRLPYIVVFIDEFADLMATTGKELESTLARLAAMSRAVGIHLVLATQRPSIDVITGLIKANIPSRIAFMVASKTDSRIIIDSIGAEKLLGRGDMLYASATDPFPIRMQGAFVSEEEVERAVEHVKTLGEPEYIDDEIFIDDEEDGEPSLFDEGGDDPLMDQALEIVMQQGKASASYIQRRLKIGYNRAARLVELMEDKGIVGPSQGSKPREIIHLPDRVRGSRPLLGDGAEAED